jgi:sulfotransferase family protein
VTELLKREAWRIRRNVAATLRQIYIDPGGDYRSTTFLAGSGRGGTTWIAELINYNNDYRFIFEPFVARHVALARPFRNRQYMRPDDDRPEYLEPARQIVSGQLRNGWSDYYNRRVVARRRLIKEIRANLFLKWLHGHFPGMPIVLLLRHPMAVASSRVYFKWNDDLDDFLLQDQLMADHLEPYRDVIKAVRDPFDKHILQWCVENSVPLRQFARGEIHLAFYENFSADPRAEIGRLFDYLKKPVIDGVFDRIGKPSSQTWRKPGQPKPVKSDPDAWRRHVPMDRQLAALEILKRFGLDAIYSTEPFPNVTAAYGMLRKPRDGT